MARSNVTFTKTQGASGRTLPNEDYVSSLIFYCVNGSLPSGFSTTNRIKQFFSIQDAETAGISNDYSDATAATFTYLITTAGATGDLIVIKVKETDGVTTSYTTIASYTKVTADSSIALLGASITAAINLGTLTHGYTASFVTATLTVNCPKKFGIFQNTGTPVTVTITGTIAGTITQPSGGAYSKQAVWHYHIKEYFRLQNGSNGVNGLYVGFFAVPGAYDFTEINTVQNFASGVIRQIGIFKDSAAYASGDLSLIDTVCKANDTLKKNLSALYAADLAAMTDITTLVNLNALTANKASSIVAQDGANLGSFLYATTGKSVTVLGAALGALSLSAVSEDFGQPIDKFNMSEGAGLELDVPAFANGVLLTDSSISDAILDSIDAKRHIFLQKYIGVSGTYFNDNHTAIISSSDYAYINDNRVIDKAIRNINSSIIVALNGKLRLNADGTLADTTIETLKSLALAPLFQMDRDGDLSEVSSSDVYINPAQDVKSTNTIIIAVSLNENGIARQIQIPIGFKSN